MRTPSTTPSVLCIGSVLWDVIGRSERAMKVGHDVPGRITRLPGGVALNVAMALKRAGLTPALLSALGRDKSGADLAAACDELGLITEYLSWHDDLPTDQYMAIEAENGLVAAVADAHSLEAAGEAILTPLIDGRLGNLDEPYKGVIALDGNLTETLLSNIATSPAFAAADLRLVPASPGKAARLKPLMGHPKATLYVNRIEAELICNRKFDHAAEAAMALQEDGCHRVLVTDGAQATAETGPNGFHIARPPEVEVRRITGAGDTFMAAHIAAEIDGSSGVDALRHAQEATAKYVSEAET